MYQLCQNRGNLLRVKRSQWKLTVLATTVLKHDSEILHQHDAVKATK